MLYLTVPDIEDFIMLVKQVGAVTHCDVMDCSRPGFYIYFVVATQLTEKALVVWSDLILQEEDPGGFEDENLLRKFHESLQKRIEERRKQVSGLLTKGGMKIRPGIYSVEAPPIFRLRT